MITQVTIKVPDHVPMVLVTAQDQLADGTWSDVGTFSVSANHSYEACAFIGRRLVIEEPAPAEDAA